jgi:hypothetical protein
VVFNWQHFNLAIFKNINSESNDIVIQSKIYINSQTIYQIGTVVYVEDGTEQTPVYNGASALTYDVFNKNLNI